MAGFTWFNRLPRAVRKSPSLTVLRKMRGCDHGHGLELGLEVLG